MGLISAKELLLQTCWLQSKELGKQPNVAFSLYFFPRNGAFLSKQLPASESMLGYENEPNTNLERNEPVYFPSKRQTAVNLQFLRHNNGATALAWILL